jgi:hypothetical protein
MVVKSKTPTIVFPGERWVISVRDMLEVAVREHGEVSGIDQEEV